MRVYIGLSVEDAKVIAVLFDVYGKRLESATFERRPGMDIESIEDEIVSMIGKLVEKEIFELQTVGIGIDDYVVSRSAAEVVVGEYFENAPIANKIKEKFACGVAVNSNVNCSVFGAYRHFDTHDKNVIGIFAGDHVGGAFITDGKLYVSKFGTSELGHIVLVPDGASCKCGNFGCLEAYASKEAIQKYIAQQHKKGRDSFVGESASRNRPMMMKSIQNAYERDDELAIEAVERAFSFLSIAIGNLTTLFQPDAVIFGGELFDCFGNRYVERIRAHVKRTSFGRHNINTKILVSELGSLSAVYGAYKLALDADIGCI